MSYTIRNLINNNKDENIAITSENNNVIKYSDLKKHIFEISGQLAGQGIMPSSRAAIVLPNGPEMATAFLSKRPFFVRLESTLTLLFPPSAAISTPLPDFTN